MFKLLNCFVLQISGYNVLLNYTNINLINSISKLHILRLQYSRLKLASWRHGLVGVIDISQYLYTRILSAKIGAKMRVNFNNDVSSFRSESNGKPANACLPSKPQTTTRAGVDCDILERILN